MKIIRILPNLLLLISLLFANTIHSQKAVVDEDVRVTLLQSGKVMVLVQLKSQALSKSGQGFQKQQILKLQNSVLSVLNKQEFLLRHKCHKYKTMPGFSGVLFENGLIKLEKHPEVERIQLDMAGQGGLAESVQAIQANKAHDLGFTGKNVVVGVLDSGVNFNHPDLNNDIIHQYHFLNRGANVGIGAFDLHGHGSNVTGIITSDGTIAPIGVAPDAKIVAIQVLGQNNRGWVSDWIAGVDYIVDNHATLNVQVINMSLVTNALFRGSNCDSQQSLFADVVGRLKNLEL